MSELDEKMDAFSKRLDDQRQQHAARLQVDLEELRKQLQGRFLAGLPADVGHQAAVVAASFSTRAPAAQVERGLIDMGSSQTLKQLDAVFNRHFRLDEYFPDFHPNTATKYCVNLAEFCEPRMKKLELSPEEWRRRLEEMVGRMEWKFRQHEHLKGFFEPGQGAFVNGWLFGQLAHCSAEEAYAREEVMPDIYATAIHEKLGHGFLSEYSELGKVESRLGFTQLRLAHEFGQPEADDPISSLRRGQASLLFENSMLLEEGWATWVESLMSQVGPHPKYTLEMVMYVIDHLPGNLPARSEIQKELQGIILTLFGGGEPPLETLRDAVYSLNHIKPELEALFENALGQTLRYIIGELLYWQAEGNLGQLCVPYTALIAANVKFDPEKMGLSDLNSLLVNDPRLHPDTRLAAISRLKPQKKDDVRGMARLAWDLFSFSAPEGMREKSNS
jgi:hypothetical protein